ncbi:hypothetical protein CDL15_Pgr001378 [Punica granatum]|uniref:RNA helicase n=1 Tax=Punica granatum TaxID=22663 RepID=A0A218WKA3_PUNGR|nr:hypothetical protein CDL15_Pgr001378 [Punica granatum]
MGKKRPRKGESRPVTEETGIRISNMLQRFRLSNDEVYTFNEELSNHERAIVHKVCRKMGLKSKSSGRGKERRVSVYKTKKKKDEKKANESLSFLSLSQQTKEVLQELFTTYPPDDAARMGKAMGKQVDNSDARKRKKDDMFRKPSMNKAEIVKKVESLSSKLEKANLREVADQRSKLPISSFKDVILSTVESHQVVLVSGETGCGKTTQVPQFLLDSMWAKGKACKIVCTQPRRISATSVAERICYERGEKIGDDIGYKIRLESKGGRNSSIVFCTNGVLLRVLITGGVSGSKKENLAKDSKDAVSDITHIIVDEIHERDRYSDFMLAIIRDILPSYPHLRLVKAFYLEDVLSILNSEQDNHLNSTSSGLNEDIELTEEDKAALDDAINLAWMNDDFDPLLDFVSSEGNAKVYNHQHSVTGMTPLMVFAGKGRTDDVRMLLTFRADCHLKSKNGATALEWAERENQLEVADLLRKEQENVHANSMEEKQLLDKYLATVNPEFIDVVLIEKLLKKICADSKVGAILIFLPGWDDINKTRDRLLASPFFKDPSKFIIISLHSMIPSADQNKVFKRPPPGCRKIILSTNIAETSITIDDVVYVIDSGRMKEKSYDPYNNVSTLQSSWVSKASAKQREGRAGRCQPGICYHLYSKTRAAALPDFQDPEIKRVPIEEICLQVKMLDPDGKIEDFLLRTLDPPVPETIQNAILLLQDIGALSSDEKLTQLGAKLGALPVHPSTSKMLFFAIMMNCLDPALTLACASDYRDPFTLPMLPNEKKRAAAAKAELASLYNGQGDHLALIAAFECWKRAKERSRESQFCSQYFVSSGTMNMLYGMRNQLERELFHNGFIPENAASCSINARDPGIVHAVLVAGLYPMVGKLLPPGKGSKRLVETAKGEKVRLHSPSTKPAFSKVGDQLLVVYDEVTRGEGTAYIRKCTIVGSLPVLLLATEIAVAPAEDDDNGGDGDESDEDDEDEYDSDDGNENEINKNESAGRNGKRVMSSPGSAVTVIADGWLYFGSTSLDIAQIYCLREQLLEAMLFKVTNPSKILPPGVKAYVYATARILSYDGLTGIPPLSMSDEAETDEAVQGSKAQVKRSGSINWIRNLMNDGNSKSPGGRDILSSFKGKPDRFGPSNYAIQLPFPSAPPNPERGAPSYGPPHQSKRQPLASASSVPQHRPPSQGPLSGRHRKGPSNQSNWQPIQSALMAPQQRPIPQGPSSARNHKGPSNQGNGQPIRPASSAPHQKPLPRDHSLVGYGSGMYGPYGPRGDTLKRPRGNMSG